MSIQKCTLKDIQFKRWAELRLDDLPKVESPDSARAQAEQMFRQANRQALQDLMRQLDPGGGFGGQGTGVVSTPAHRLLDLIDRGEVVMQHGFTSQPRVPMVTAGEDGPRPNPALDPMTRCQVKRLLDFNPPAKPTPLAVRKAKPKVRKPVPKSDPARDPQEPEICLLPLRQALVEKLDSSKELGSSYTLKTRPMGLRLMRDGFVYFIDEKSETVHEFEIKDGWPATPIAFPRDSAFHVTYSEVQWTEDKKQQAKGDKDKRMKRIELRNASSTPPRGSGLITLEQAGKWLAEAAEGEVQPGGNLPEGAHEEERKPYVWEHEPLFSPIDRGELKARITGEEKYAYCLVLPDPVGVMRDLAAYQDKVVEWIDDWAKDEETNKKYQLGCYIESMYVVSEAGLLAKAQENDDFAKLFDDTSPEQRQAILDYLDEHAKNPSLLRELALDYLPGGNLLTRSIKQELTGFPLWAARERMINSLGEPLYEKYAPLIEEQVEQTRTALEGEAASFEKGIDHFIDRPAMEAFLAVQRTHLQRWNTLLDRITTDRVWLLTNNLFHDNAWWFDAQLEEHVVEALLAEYACGKDICRSPASTSSIAKWLDKEFLADEPLVYTLSISDYKELRAVLANLTRDEAVEEMRVAGAGQILEAATRHKGVAKIKDFAGQWEKALANKGLGRSSFSAAAADVNTLRDRIYRPAKSLAWAEEVEKIVERFKSGSVFTPGEVLRDLPTAFWRDLLREFGSSGVTVNVATLEQLTAFQNDVDAAKGLRRRLDPLEGEYQQATMRPKKGLSKKRRQELKVRAGELHKAILPVQQELEALELRIAGAMSPEGDGPAQVGLRISGVEQADLPEIRRVAAEFRLGRPSALSQAKAVLVSDSLASIVALMQIMNLRSALSAFFAQEPDKRDLRALVAPATTATAATFAALQGITLTRLEVALGHYATIAGKASRAAPLGRLTGILGGIGYVAGFVAGLYSLRSSLARWDEALRRGDGQAMLGAAMALGGDVVMTGAQAWGFYQYVVTAKGAKAAGQGWAIARYASIFYRTNILMLAGTGFWLIGEWLYHDSHRSKMQAWLETSPWGTKNNNAALEEYERALLDITVLPKPEKENTGARSTVRITVPDLSLWGLDEAKASLTVFHAPGPAKGPRDWREVVSNRIQVTRASPLQLSIPVFPDPDMDGYGSLGLKLSYDSELVPGHSRELRFQTESLNSAPFRQVGYLKGEGGKEWFEDKGLPVPKALPLTRDRLLRALDDKEQSATQGNIK